MNKSDHLQTKITMNNQADLKQMKINAKRIRANIH